MPKSKGNDSSDTQERLNNRQRHTLPNVGSDSIHKDYLQEQIEA